MLITNYFHNKFMRKEKVNKVYRKPQISLICPQKFFQRVSPTIVLTQPLKERQQITDRFSQDNKEILSTQKFHAVTCSQWNVSPKHTDNFMSEKSKIIQERTCQAFFKRKKSIQHKKLIIKNSPYVKNQKQYQRLLHVLKPVKGPTQSLINQIKKHNQVNKKNAQNVLLSTKDSFKQKIMKYTSRIGLKNNEKIFIMNSKDNHIRQALQRNGWVEALDRSSTFFHLKWVYTDSPNDYVNLQQGQFFNHFKNNQQLTNKNLLRKNIYKSLVNFRPNFPMTFDLQLNQDQMKFHAEYIKYQSFKILDKLHQFIKQNYQAEYKKMIKQNILGLAEGNQFHIVVNKIKQKQIIAVLLPKILQRPQFSQVRQIRQILYYFCFALTDQIDKINKTKNSIHGIGSLNFSNLLNKKDCPSNSDINRALNSFIRYINQDFGSQQKQNLIKILNYDKFLMIFLLLLHKSLKINYISNFGTQNWWIVKPAGVSRGTGIKIQTDASKILTNKYGRIVQKYIQKPLLLKCGRKFDIRQWVLVKSFIPFQVYKFERCYCRFSATKYSCSNNQNLFIHLTNYSKQKQHFNKSNKNNQSIMSQQELQIQIDNSTWQGKWNVIKSQITQQIIKTLKCCQYEVEDKSQCFQVFGFDIILDNQYKPWVLEVNLSPACQKRAEFLNEYLDNMAEGLIDMMEGRQIRYWRKLEDHDKIDSPRLKQKQKIINKNKLTAEYAAYRIQRWYRKNRKNNLSQITIN